MEIARPVNPQGICESLLNPTLQKVVPQNHWIKWKQVEFQMGPKQYKTVQMYYSCMSHPLKGGGGVEINCTEQYKHILKWKMHCSTFSMELTSPPVQGNWAALLPVPIPELSISW